MLNPVRILLVDDSPYFLEAARMFFHLNNTIEVVATASDSEEALAKAQTLNPDVILLDLNLGDQSGLDLIPLFREYLPQTRIIVLTIMYEHAYRAASMQAGADAFVDKIAMNKTLVPLILQQLGRPAGEQKADQPPAAKPEQPAIENDQEPKK